MTTSTASGPMIQTHDLRRTFKVRGKKEDIEAVRGVDLRVGAGWLPRPQWGRQDHHASHARDAPNADLR